MDKEINLEEIQEFTRRHGRPMANRLLSILGKHHDFYEAYNTKVGQELLKDLMAKMDMLLGKLVDGQITEEERLEYKICREIFDAWMKRIKIYTNHVNKLKGA